MTPISSRLIGLFIILLAGACTERQTQKSPPGTNPATAQCQIAAAAHDPRGGTQEMEITPAPPSVGTDIPVTYFGPSPSQVKPELIGPYLLLKAGKLDLNAGTITLPLYRGKMRTTGANVWYVLTDTTDERNAAALGLLFSAKLNYAYVPGTKATRTGTVENDGTITFDQGTVDFAPEHSVVAGDPPNGFPPKSFQPGSVGDADYSPLVHLTNAGGHTYNAPIIAFGVDAAAIDSCNSRPDHSKVHDKVVRLCPAEQTVTLSLFPGFSFGRPVLYLSLDANKPDVAAIEQVTLAPGLDDVLTGHDDGAFSAVERLFTFTNGPINPTSGKSNPQRQGLSSALLDHRSPLNVLGGIPTVATDYSPLWDVNVAEWTPEAVARGYRSRLTEEFQVLGFVAKGWLTGPGGSKFGSSGAIVNCPVTFRFL